MEFFTQEDFDFFTSVKGKPYRKNNAEHVAIGQRLKKTVYDKTKYWAELMGQQGYHVKPEVSWQSSGHFRSYTWAKITLPGVENEQVFFTIGVGSRFSEAEGVACQLDYKLDCLRWTTKALDPSMVFRFDTYMQENCLEAMLKQIDIAQAGGWEALVARVQNFIRTYQQHYLELCELTTVTARNPLRKIVRLCWNTKRWVVPSGAEGKSLSKGHAFEKDKGYGYEEWLFNPRHEIDGYRYGFVQAFYKGGHQGNAFEVAAYAIQNHGKYNSYYWIAKFALLEVLSFQQQRWAVEEFEKRGWTEQMREELQALGIDNFNFQPIGADQLINVRYRIGADSFVQYDLPIPIDQPKAELGGNRHYVLLSKESFNATETKPLGKFTFKKGHRPVGTETVPGKRTQIDYLMRMRHKHIQCRIFEQLEQEFEGSDKEIGTENVTEFGKSIDLVVCSADGRCVFYEIKTCRLPLQCVREAVGQLMEYAFYAQSNHSSELVVIGLGKADDNLRRYMAHLRTLSTPSIYYQWFDEQRQMLDWERI